MSVSMLVVWATLGGAHDYAATVEVRETAGIARQNEPVVVRGTDLVKLWGTRVDTRRIRVADDKGRPVPSQVDERDGKPYYAVRPNRVLDADDEIVWQASVDARGTRTYTLFVAGPGGRPTPQTDLSVGPAPKGAGHSAAIVMRNAYMEVGVRGWPVSKKRFSGCGAGAITYFRLFGQNQTAQGEGHGFYLNSGHFLDGLY